MKKVDLAESRKFNPLQLHRFLVHDSPYFRIINFNLAAGQVFPVHAHDTDGELSILVLEGEGEFLGGNEAAIPAKAGEVLLAEIREPHGVRAKTEMRLLVTIAPPL